MASPGAPRVTGDPPRAPKGSLSSILGPQRAPKSSAVLPGPLPRSPHCHPGLPGSHLWLRKCSGPQQTRAAILSRQQQVADRPAVNSGQPGEPGLGTVIGAERKWGVPPQPSEHSVPGPTECNIYIYIYIYIYIFMYLFICFSFFLFVTYFFEVLCFKPWHGTGV